MFLLVPSHFDDLSNLQAECGYIDIEVYQRNCIELF